MSSIEIYPPVIDQHEAPLRDYSMVFVGGGGGVGTMIEGTIDVLEPRGMLVLPNYDQDVVVQPTGGVRLTAATGGADGGSANGDSKRHFEDLAMGDAVNIMSRSIADHGTRGILRDRFKEDDREDVMYERGLKLAEVAVRNGASLARVEETVELAVKKYASLMDAMRRKDGARGDLNKHRFGVAVMHALNEMHGGNASNASRELGKWVAARADVLISSHTPHDIYLIDGKKSECSPNIVFGEGRIDGYSPRNPMKAALGTRAVRHGKVVEISDELWTAYTEADVIADAPGSVFASKLAVQVAKGSREAFAEQARRGGSHINISNLVEEEESRLGLTAAQQAEINVNFNGGRKYDAVIYNTAIANLRHPIIPYDKSADEEFSAVAAEHIAANLVDQSFIGEQDTNDPIASKRSKAAHSVPAVMRELDKRKALPFSLTSA